MGRLYNLHREEFIDIPTPYNSLPDDSYAVLEIDGESYPMLTGSGVVVAKENTQASNCLHIIQVSIGCIVARLVFLEDSRVKIESLCADFPSHTTDLDKIIIVGLVCELYPKGFDGPRWILWESSMGSRNQCVQLRPALKATS